MNDYPRPGGTLVLDFRMTRERSEQLRAEAIARGEFPEVLNTAEAALFTRRSEDSLLKSDAPRSCPKGRGTGKRKSPIWLKSQLIAWLESKLTYRADEPPSVLRRRRKLGSL